MKNELRKIHVYYYYYFKLSENRVQWANGSKNKHTNEKELKSYRGSSAASLWVKFVFDVLSSNATSKFCDIVSRVSSSWGKLSKDFFIFALKQIQVRRCNTLKCLIWFSEYQFQLLFEQLRFSSRSTDSAIDFCIWFRTPISPTTMR